MPIDVVRVVDAGHNMMVDNPEGFLDAFWNITVEATKKDPLNQTSGMVNGQMYGYAAWMHERKTMDFIKSKHLPKIRGADVIASSGVVMEGRTKEQGADRKTKYKWIKCSVEEDHGDGTFRVLWMEGGSQGKWTSRFGGHLLRCVEEVEGKGRRGLEEGKRRWGVV